MIPKALTEWTEASIRRLLANGVFENETFDWKVSLPSSKVEPDKLRLRKSCAAFANSNGGFLVFGVADDRSLPVDDRLVGVEKDAEFFESFGNYPSQCRPAVDWDPRPDPIRLANGRLIHVIEIPQTRTGPHAVAVDSPKDNGVAFVFPKRTNKGTEFMSYEEVRMAFYGQHDRITQLSVLRLEVVSIRDDMVIMAERMRRNPGLQPATEVSVTVLERVIAECYLLLATDPEVLRGLMRVRRQAREFNNIQQTTFSVMIGRYDGRQKNLSQQLALATADDLARTSNTVLGQVDKLVKSLGFVLPDVPPLDQDREVNRSNWSGSFLGRA